MSHEIIVNVLLFGHYRDRAPKEAKGGMFTVVLNSGATVTDLAAELGKNYVGLSDLLQKTRVAVGAEFVPAETVLNHGDETAFLPPMSGG